MLSELIQINGRKRALNILIKIPLAQFQPKPKAVYIVGCGHSGTSLLNKVLSTHSNFWAVGGESWLYASNHEEDYIKAQILTWITSARESRKYFLLEKTPKHVQHIPEILNIQPKSKFIGITRNPLDTISSLVERGVNLDNAIERYISDNTQLLNHSDKVKIIKLESLIDQFDDTINGVQNFLSLPHEDLSQFHLKPTFFDSKKIEKPTGHRGENHGIKRNYQVNQPLFDSRGKWKTILNKEDQFHVKNLTKEITLKLGYSNALQQP